MTDAAALIVLAAVIADLLNIKPSRKEMQDIERLINLYRHSNSSERKPNSLSQSDNLAIETT